MRTTISFLMLACYFVTISAEATYYYSDSKKIPLYENPSKVIVRSPKGYQQPSQKTSAFHTIRTTSCNGYDITLAEKNEDISLESIKTSMLANTPQRSVYPCYKNETGADVIPTSYIYVELKTASDFDKLINIATEYGCSILKQNRFMPLWYTLCLTSDTGADSVEIANKIMETQLFANACPAFEVSLAISFDPLVGDQWGLYNSYFESIDISASEAWNYATGRGVTVAVIDTGIDMTHEDLHENIHPSSYNAVTGTSPSILDTPDNYHGTHCAGIIGAVRNNNKGIVGVAPDVSLMSINVDFNSADVEDQLANGIIWAYQNGADILSCSWVANAESPLIKQAINRALTNGRNGKGCIMVYSVGNDLGTVKFPANYREEIIGVGSIERNGMWAFFSSNGDGLFVCAPGKDILSTVPDNGYAEDTGTSMACPHVSGLVALMLELNPHLTNSQIRGIIATTTKKVGHLSYSIDKQYGRWNQYYGYGLINAAQAVKCTPRN